MPGAFDGSKSQADADETAASEDGDGGEVDFESPEVKRYCQFADRFARLLVDEKYDDAYALCCDDLRKLVTKEQFADARRKDRAKFGTPRKCPPSSAAETDRNILRGPEDVKAEGDRLSQGIDKISAARAVGDMPRSIPFDIRRAGVQIDLEIDPRTVSKEETKGAELDADDEVYSYLHVVVVEEKGELKVGHVWQRWPDILD
jgi:hypothetical protein